MFLTRSCTVTILFSLGTKPRRIICKKAATEGIIRFVWPSPISKAGLSGGSSRQKSGCICRFLSGGGKHVASWYVGGDGGR